MKTEIAPALPFTAEEAELANEEWRATCGHFSIAAACNVPLPQVKAAYSKLTGWTSPTMLKEALNNLRRGFAENKLPRGCPHEVVKFARFHNGAPVIFRIQWEGRWLDEGVPPRVAYFHTHWVAMRDGYVFDPMLFWASWDAVQSWPDRVDAAVRLMARDEPKPKELVTGWHFTHAYLLSKA
jgi:hypothetical protein